MLSRPGRSRALPLAVPDRDPLKAHRSPYRLSRDEQADLRFIRDRAAKVSKMAATAPIRVNRRWIDDITNLLDGLVVFGDRYGELERSINAACGLADCSRMVAEYFDVTGSDQVVAETRARGRDDLEEAFADVATVLEAILDSVRCQIDSQAKTRAGA